MSISSIVVFVVFLHIEMSSSGPISSCLPTTSCQCQFIRQTFLIVDCGYSLPDLPVLNSKTPINVTEIVAREALIRWPFHVCHYWSLERLDLSGSMFDARQIDVECLSKLIYFNLSRTNLKTVPMVSKFALNDLEIFDLSNNFIQILDGQMFRWMTKLKILSFERNPLKRIDHLEELFHLPQIEMMNFLTWNSTRILRKPLNASQWIYFAHQWNSSNRSITFHTDSIPLQSILPPTNQLMKIPVNALQIILRTLAHSIFTSPSLTPKCSCRDIRIYQRVFSFVDQPKNLSALFRSSTCRMSNGFIHARLFDREILRDLNCSNLAKTSSSSVSSENNVASSSLISSIYSLATTIFVFIFIHQ